MTTTMGSWNLVGGGGGSMQCRRVPDSAVNFCIVYNLRNVCFVIPRYSSIDLRVISVVRMLHEQRSGCREAADA